MLRSSFAVVLCVCSTRNGTASTWKKSHVFKIIFSWYMDIFTQNISNEMWKSLTQLDVGNNKNYSYETLPLICAWFWTLVTIVEVGVESAKGKRVNRKMKNEKKLKKRCFKKRHMTRKTRAKQWLVKLLSLFSKLKAQLLPNRLFLEVNPYDVNIKEPHH